MIITQIYKKLRQLPILNWYTKYKLWLRNSVTGRAIDRAVRFFVITAISTFLTNYAVGQEIIPVLQTSIGVAAIALFDKIKNEILAKAREDKQIEITIL